MYVGLREYRFISLGLCAKGEREWWEKKFVVHRNQYIYIETRAVVHGVRRLIVDPLIFDGSKH